jgi:diguanylate cyclase (GGDEF)-like protein
VIAPLQFPAARRRAGHARLLAEAGAALLASPDAAAVQRVAAAVTAELLGGAGPVPGNQPAVRDALDTLRSQVALALERAGLAAELARRDSVDPLTGLANRARFSQRLGEVLAGLQASGGTAAVLLLDLDDFTTINDSLGHAHGDEVLVVVAGRLRTGLEEDDLAARLGGDKFAVVRPRVADQAEAVAVAERLAASLRSPVAVSGRELLARASVGVRLAGGDDEDPERLLRDADMAMHAAKTAGRGGVRVFDTAMHTRAVQRLDFEAALRRAVIRQQFTVRYQPVVELAGGRLAGLEALVRWDHPERGLVMAGEFVGLAEDTGLIVPIGRWVLHAACQALRDWQRRFPLERPPFLSVHLSVRQLQQPDLLEDVAGALDASGLDPGELMLEITDSVLAADQEAMVERLRGLRALGVHLAIDDFATGHSSLAYLRNLPVDTLKLTKPFVGGLLHGAEEAALSCAILRVADLLGLQVIAEGVEQEAQALALADLGCPYGQGPHFAPPLDQFAVEALLVAEQGRRAAASRRSRSQVV